MLHGEFTTNLTGTPTVMVVQTGQVTAYTAGKSLTVESTDGFEATYTLDGGTATTGRNATALANGVQVRVVAAKDGMKVTALVGRLTARDTCTHPSPRRHGAGGSVVGTGAGSLTGRRGAVVQDAVDLAG